LIDREAPRRSVGKPCAAGSPVRPQPRKS